MGDARMDWRQLVDRARSVSSGAIEISALSGPELPSLIDWAVGSGVPPFGYVSVHGPTKAIGMHPAELAGKLDQLPPWITSIVLHPDTLGRPQAFRSLGRRLVIENMDFRKRSGRTPEDLEALFAVLPDAGFCLDVAHARSLDSSMTLARELLDRFADRLRQFHVSSLDAAGHHVSLLKDDLRACRPLLDRFPNVPVIFESPVPEWLRLSH